MTFALAGAFALPPGLSLGGAPWTGIGTGLSGAAVPGTPRLFGPVPAATAAADVTLGIPLFYGRFLNASAWLSLDQSTFNSAAQAGTLTLSDLYNQWLAIENLRAVVYQAWGTVLPDGAIVYDQQASVELHALDLAAWAREEAIMALLAGTGTPPYPPTGYLAYRLPGDFLSGPAVPDSVTVDQVAGIMAGLGVPDQLFAGDRIFLLPYEMSGEIGASDVLGPGFRLWLSAGASIDLSHVLAQELGHAVAFRFGGYDTTAAGQALSPFWQTYLAIRNLTWRSAGQGPVPEQTPECFAEDFAYLLGADGGPLGYQADCGVPPQAQAQDLISFLRALSPEVFLSPFQQAAWVRWRSPLRDVLFGDFQALYFTSAPTLPLTVALDPAAVGGPYTLQIAGGSGTLAQLRPGQRWSGVIALPAQGSVEINAQTPDLILSALQVVSDPAFAPDSAISGVFPDTAGHWAETAISVAANLGIVDGYPGGNFAPDAPVTRAEFAKMLSTAVGLKRVATRRFADVPRASWAYPYVQAIRPVVSMATFAGADFRPSDPIRREDAIAWAVRALGLPPAPAAAEEALAQAYPGGAIAPEDLDAVAAAIQAGLLPSGEAIRPAAPLSRAQAVVLALLVKEEALGSRGSI